MTSEMDDPPPGFRPYDEPSPFLDRIGPLYQKDGAAGPVFGLWARDYHCNRRGIVHGGLLVSFADIVLGKTMSWSQDPPARLLTASLSVDFLGAGRLGDWIEAVCDSHRIGRRLAFANCYLSVEGRNIVRASGAFSVTDGG